MGNLENGCLSRNSQSTMSNNSNRPSIIKRQYASEKIRTQFLYPINLKEILQYAKAQGISQFDPHSSILTKQMIQLSKQNNFLELSLCRFLLISTNYDQKLIGEMLKENQEFRQSILPIENNEIRNYIKVIGLDFSQGLVLYVKIEKNYIQLVQQYILFFLEYLFYEIANQNKLSNHIVIVYDLQFEAISAIFLNFIANLTYKHYFLNIRKLILININLEKVSSEVIGMLNSKQFSYLILPLSDISYLLRHIKKSELSQEFGGIYQYGRQPIPLNLKEAQNFKL